MAQSEKIFRELLCEGRAHHAETTDPAGLRTIDELRKSVSNLRAELEAERVRGRQLQRDHEAELRLVREELDNKYEQNLEALSLRKSQEKDVELKHLEERLARQQGSELQQLHVQREEELRRQQRRLEREREEAVRQARELDQKQLLEELQDTLPEAEVRAREAKLTKEIFQLGEHSEQLEEQVQLMSRENRAQIDLLRRMKHEHKAEVDSIVKKHQTEAAREMAQLRLAERIIEEKDYDLQIVEYKADMVVQEKEALAEKVALLRSQRNTGDISARESSPARRGVAAPAGSLLQRRVEELEAALHKSEEERSELKQENAALRKKLAQEGAGGGVGGGGGECGDGGRARACEEKLKKLRKRNAELVALAKQLDERCKASKMENEQLQKASVSPGEAEQAARKTLSRQHTKDIMEYTRQLHFKDRELDTLRKKLSRLEVSSPPRVEPSPELERKVKAMALERLRMERLISKLYTKVPGSDVDEVGVLAGKELQPGDQTQEGVAEENLSLRRQLAELHGSVSHGDEVDSGQHNGDWRKLQSELQAETAALKAQQQEVDKLQGECSSLQQTVADLQQTNAGMESRVRQLTAQLNGAVAAASGLEASQDECLRLQDSLTALQREQAETKASLVQMEAEQQRGAALLAEREGSVQQLQRSVSELEAALADRERECLRLQSAVPPPMVDASLQTSPPPSRPEPRPSEPRPHTTDTNPGARKSSRERVKSPVHRDVARLRKSSGSPRVELEAGGTGLGSLEHEMRAAGVEVTDSFDSSEGVGFSESVVEEGASTHSLESFVSREEEGTLLQLGEGPSGRPALQTKSSWTEAKTESEGSGAMATPLNFPLAVTHTGSDETVKEVDHVTSHDAQPPQSTPPPLDYAEVINPAESGDSSASDPPTLPNNDVVQPDVPLPQQPAGSPSAVAVYIAKYTYKPSEMSPNQQPLQELSLTAGDYLYVFGEMDEDGFYQGQLMSGESGLVPSNFIQEVEEGDESSPLPPRKPLARRRLSNLQDIEEEDEAATSSSSLAVEATPPPRHLQLERQFVDGDSYSVELSWQPPRPRPLQTTGYAVYVNGGLQCSVQGAEERGVLLTGVPRHQLVRISVRTVTQEGESLDPEKLIVLNPQYPIPPSGVTVSVLDNQPRALQVEWRPAHSQAGGNPITHFNIYTSGQRCVQLAASATPSESVCAQLYREDLSKLALPPPVTLTVRSSADRYESQDSRAVLVSAEQLVQVLQPVTAAVVTGGDTETASSSLDSPSEEEEEEEEREVYSPAKRTTPSLNEPDHVSRGDGHVTNGAEVVENHEAETKAPPTHYFRALFAYDPYYHSPNEEGAEEELPFEEGDIIMACGETDEDGFFEGQIGSRSGYVPSNMVEEVTEPDELAQLLALLAVKQQRRNRTRATGGAEPAFNGRQRGAGQQQEAPPPGTRVKALFDYDPKQDSPNEQSEAEAELNFVEGDIITVFGKPDSDGYFQAQLGGKTGLVPQNFVRDLQSPDQSHDQLPGEEDVGIEVFAADTESMKEAQKIFNTALGDFGSRSSGTNQSSTDERKEGAKKKNLLSKGKGLLSKGSRKKGN